MLYSSAVVAVLKGMNIVLCAWMFLQASCVFVMAVRSHMLQGPHLQSSHTLDCMWGLQC